MNKDFFVPNLLLNVLAVAVVAAPFHQDVWPEPLPQKVAQQVAIPQNLLLTPEVKALPFRQTEWLNPEPRRVLQVEIPQNLLLAPGISPPFKPVDLPIAREIKGILTDNPPNLLETTLAPTAVPFSLLDWPNPQRIISQDTGWTQNLLPLYETPTPVIIAPSRSHKEEKRRAIDWSVPFVVQEEELKVVEQKIEEVKKEISQEKKQVTSTSNVYEINAISGRIDDLMANLESLLAQRLRIQEIISTSPIVIRGKAKAEELRLKLERLKKEEEERVRILIEKQKKKIAAELKVEKFLKALDHLDRISNIEENEDYEVVYVKKVIRRKKK